MRKTTLLLMLVLSRAAVGQSTDVDWKFYGTASLGKSDNETTFYDSKGVIRRLDGHIEVWTKGLHERDIQRVENSDKKHVERVATKLLTGYEPPYATVATVDRDLKITLMQLEDVANNAQVNPTMRMLIEIDCGAQMFRWLSVYLSMGGKKGFSETPSEWQHIGPETNAIVLKKLLCPRP
jgi:hypothetical protein